jgi:hypothetical protein
MSVLVTLLTTLDGKVPVRVLKTLYAERFTDNDRTSRLVHGGRISASIRTVSSKVFSYRSFA